MKETTMNITDLKELISLLSTNDAAEPTRPSRHIGEKVIVRTYASGVHYGTLVYHDGGRFVELNDSRRIWAFDVKSVGISLSEVAVHGPVDSRTRICTTVPQIDITDALEIIPCTEAAIKVIEEAKVYVP